jgi:NAD(P)-dependent dehydrogenase (short-subunit alcohol dehydrogenase family)
MEIIEMLNGLAIEKGIATLDDVVQIVAFLASEESRWMNGNLVPASGGFRW